MSWRVATSLDVLLDEINTLAPNRDKASDGSIGDADHSTRASDHNPWREGRTVGARDFTHDPFGGLDCDDLADFLDDQLRKPYDELHPALRSGAYVIWESQIISRDRIAEGWRPYSGSNPHDKHLHLSVATAWGDFETTRPWGWAERGETVDYDKLRKIVREEVDKALDVQTLDVGDRPKVSVRRALAELLQRVPPGRAGGKG